MGSYARRTDELFTSENKGEIRPSHYTQNTVLLLVLCTNSQFVQRSFVAHFYCT